MKELTDIEMPIIAGALCECYGSDAPIKNSRNLSKISLRSTDCKSIKCGAKKCTAV